jgi:hypothetical protein
LRKTSVSGSAKVPGWENDLAKEGTLQQEIAPTLGVSVMTLHRWRKSHTDAAAAAPDEVAHFGEQLGWVNDLPNWSSKTLGCGAW